MSSCQGLQPQVMPSSESPADFQGDSPAAIINALIESQRVAMLRTYAQALSEGTNPLSQDAAALEQALENAAQILGDVVRAIRTGRTDPDDSYRLLAWE